MSLLDAWLTSQFWAFLRMRGINNPQHQLPHDEEKPKQIEPSAEQQIYQHLDWKQERNSSEESILFEKDRLQQKTLRIINGLKEKNQMNQNHKSGDIMKEMKSYFEQILSSKEDYKEILKSKQILRVHLKEGYETYDTLLRQSRSKQSMVKELNQKLEELKAQQYQSEQNIGRLEAIIKNKGDQHRIRKLKSQELETQVGELEKRYEQLKEEISQGEEQKKQLLQAVESLELRNREPIAPSDKYRHLFIGDILSTHQEAKEFLINEIIKIEQRQVDATNFLYRYPTFGKINFHELIDGKSHYVVLIKLTNQMLIAAYSQEPLVEGRENCKEGFLASLTNQKSYYLKKSNPKARLTSYNEYYIVFGNAELRIKSGGLKVESNVGSSIRFFNTGSLSSPEVLFGRPNKEAEFVCYEVFEVVLGEQL